MFRSTDFASKGLYKPTTTVGGPTDLSRWLESKMASEAWRKQGTDVESLRFKETSNLRLSGSTFDSGHLNKFMQNCPFVQKAAPHYL